MGMKHSQRKRCLAIDDYTCCNCGSEENLTVDHIIPKKYRGKNHCHNLQTLCWKCNHEKRTSFALCRDHASVEQKEYIKKQLAHLKRQGIVPKEYFQTRSKTMKSTKDNAILLPECNVDALLRSTNGRWFSISFIKANGNYRRIVGKLANKNQLVDIKHPHRLLWDSHPDVFSFRKANLATAMTIVADHKTYRVI